LVVLLAITLNSPVRSNASRVNLASTRNKIKLMAQYLVNIVPRARIPVALDRHFANLATQENTPSLDLALIAQRVRTPPGVTRHVYPALQAQRRHSTRKRATHVQMVFICPWRVKENVYPVRQDTTQMVLQDQVSAYLAVLENFLKVQETHEESVKHVLPGLMLTLRVSASAFPAQPLLTRLCPVP